MPEDIFHHEFNEQSLIIEQIRAPALFRPTLLQAIGEIQGITACSGAFFRLLSLDVYSEAFDFKGFYGGHLLKPTREIRIEQPIEHTYLLAYEHATSHPKELDKLKQSKLNLLAETKAFLDKYGGKNNRAYIPTYAVVYTETSQLLNEDAHSELGKLRLGGTGIFFSLAKRMPRGVRQDYVTSVLLPWCAREPLLRRAFLEAITGSIIHEVGHQVFEDRLVSPIPVLRRLERIKATVRNIPVILSYDKKFKDLLQKTLHEYHEYVPAEEGELIDQAINLNHAMISEIAANIPNPISRREYIRMTRLTGLAERFAEAFEIVLGKQLERDALTHWRYANQVTLYIYPPDMAVEIAKKLGSPEDLAKNALRVVQEEVGQVERSLAEQGENRMSG